MSEVIDYFLKNYLHRRDFFERAAAICHEQCREILLQNGIRHIVTYRTKRPDRLRDKLYNRQREGKSYSSEEDLFEDLNDLAGVRVALYFPGDRREATNLLCRQFLPLEDPKHFKGSDSRRGSEVYTHRFSGYSATHLKVRLRPERLGEDENHYAEARVEIQIASLMMHAWAEVEHDLVYKPFQGELSEAEHALLDQVNGLAYSAEIALEQLQAAMRNRVARGQVRFENHYEVAALIHTALKLPESGDFRMGRADQILCLLREESLDRPDQLTKYLDFMPESGVSPSVTDQVVNRIAQSVPKRAKALRERWLSLKKSDVSESEEISPVHDQAEIRGWEIRERFQARWRTLERLLLRIQSMSQADVESTQTWLDLNALEQAPGFTTGRRKRIAEARSWFHRLARGEPVGSNDDLAALADEVSRLIEWLYLEFPEVQE